MRKFIVFVIVLLALASPCQGYKKSSGLADIEWLLRCWPTGLSVSNQSYTNGQVIDTLTEGCLVGSLTANFGSGDSISLASNYMTVNNVNSSGDTTVCSYGQAITKSLGLGLFSNQLINSTIDTVSQLGLSDASTDWVTNRVYDSAQDYLTSKISFVYGTGSSSVYIVSLASITPGTAYPVAFILGGYDSGGVPYKTGDTKSNFTYGVSFFAKLSGTWYLLWKESANNTSTLYPFFASYRYVSKYSNILIPNYDFSTVLQPTFLDTFTGADGTSLADHTPDVGGAWSVLDGTPTISSNKVTSTGAAHATTSTGLADAYISAHVSVNGDNTAGLIIRESDINTLFLIGLYNFEDKLRLLEKATTYTERASSAFSISLGTEYLVTAIISGTSIKGYAGASSVSYSSSTNQAVTNHGIRIANSGDTIDNFAVWPLTSATYTSEFAKVGY